MEMVEKAQASAQHEFRNEAIGIKNCKLVHKYADSLLVDIWLELGGTDTQRLFLVNIRRKNNAASNLMVTDPKGRIEYCTSGVGAMLGYSAKHLRKMEIDRLMPQPFNRLHQHWMKVSHGNGACVGRFLSTT